MLGHKKLFEAHVSSQRESPMNRRNNQQMGFSLVEGLIAMFIIVLVVGMALIKTTVTLPNYKANAAADVVMSQLRLARQVAISQRRNVQVTIDQTFTGVDNAQHISFQILASQNGGTPPPAQTIQLPRGTQIVLESGVADTPMLFGNSSAVCFGTSSGTCAAPTLVFTSTGSFTDGNNSLLNGTIFVGVPNTPTSARAVTVMGGTGRIRSYTYTGSQWVE
jgi:Tfp pilus assembly protein FimT